MDPDRAGPDLWRRRRSTDGHRRLADLHHAATKTGQSMRDHRDGVAFVRVPQRSAPSCANADWLVHPDIGAPFPDQWGEYEVRRCPLIDLACWAWGVATPFCGIDTT